jgi:proline dehydrogenase
MAALKEILTAAAKRKEVVADCAKLLDEEVASKSGFSGLAVKAAFATVKALKPGMIPHTIDDLLDEFADKVDPFYQAAKDAKQPVDAYIAGHAVDIAEALLQITDGRAAKTMHGTIKKAYEKLRPAGKKHTAEAMPRVGKLILKHAG